MAVEAKRGCGYRKVGGLYLVGEFGGAPCCRMPILLNVCPCCGAGIKQSRGWQWIDPRPFLVGECTNALQAVQLACPAADPGAFGERVGLVWIGEKFYPTVAHFAAEARRLGVSRRVAALPRGFKLGESWVWLAHPKACRTDEGEKPGVFYVWKPKAIEKIVLQSEYDQALRAARGEAQPGSPEAEALARFDKDAKAGVKWVPVPDGDRDHQGSVYDKPDEDDGASGELGL